MVAYIVTTATRSMTGVEFLTHRAYGCYSDADAAAAAQTAKAHLTRPGDLPCPIEVPRNPERPTRLTEWGRYANSTRVAVVHELDGEAAVRIHDYLARGALLDALDAAHAAWVAAYLAAADDLDDPATVAARARLAGLLLVWLDGDQDAATKVLASVVENEHKTWRRVMNTTAEDQIDYLKEIGEDYPETVSFWVGHRVPTGLTPINETEVMGEILAAADAAAAAA